MWWVDVIISPQVVSGQAGDRVSYIAQYNYPHIPT